MDVLNEAQRLNGLNGLRCYRRLGGESSVTYREHFDVSKIPETWKFPLRISVLELLNFERLNGLNGLQWDCALCYRRLDRAAG